MQMSIIRKCYNEKRFNEALALVETQMAISPECPQLWIIRGNLIQLTTVPDLPLEEAEKSYLKALELHPTNIEALEDLSHFYYAVMDDKTKARPIFKRLVDRHSAMLNGIKEIQHWLAETPPTQENPAS